MPGWDELINRGRGRPPANDAQERIDGFLTQEKMNGLDSALEAGGRKFINGRWYINEAPMNSPTFGSSTSDGGGSGGGIFGSASGGLAPSYRDPAGFFPDRSADRSSRLAKTLQDLDAGYRGQQAYATPGQGMLRSGVMGRAPDSNYTPGGILNDFNETMLRSGGGAPGGEDELRARLQARSGENIGNVNRSESIQEWEMGRRRSEVIDQLRAMLEGGKMGADLQFGQFGLQQEMFPYEQMLKFANLIGPGYSGQRSSSTTNGIYGGGLFG